MAFFAWLKLIMKRCTGAFGQQRKENSLVVLSSMMMMMLVLKKYIMREFWWLYYIACPSNDEAALNRLPSTTSAELPIC